MIFKKEHIEQIRKGIKTQTRRVNRGIYQVGRDYAVQPGRGKKGVGMRIVIDDIWLESMPDMTQTLRPLPKSTIPISGEDAEAEGLYTPYEFEFVFNILNPGWDGNYRWVFKFHVKEE